MFPAEAIQRQIAQYRAMTGQQRLQIALDLHESACNVAREGIPRTTHDLDFVLVTQLGQVDQLVAAFEAGFSCIWCLS